MQSIRHAAREWRRTPWLAASVVATIALCVGANVSVFAAVRAVLLQSLPYPDADRLVAIGIRPAGGSRDSLSVTPATFFAWRDQSPGGRLAAYHPEWNVTLVRPSGSRRLIASAISHDALQVLGIRVAIGRSFSPEDEWSGTGQQVILTNELWREQFQGRLDIVNSDIVLGADGWPLGRQRSAPNGTTFTVVGVLAAGATLPGAHTQLVVPLRALGDDRSGLTPRVLRVIGRVDGGDGDRERLAAQLASVSVPGAPPTITPFVAPLRDVVVGDVRQFLGIVTAAVVAVLLLGVANVATLMLLRSARRARETAIRVAMGARLTDLLRPAVADTVVLGLLGGTGALVIAKLTLSVGVPLLDTDLRLYGGVGVDVAVAAFALGISAFCVLVPAAAAILRLPRQAPYGLLRDGQRAVSPSAAGTRARTMLIGTQLVLGFVLLSAASLLIKSVRELMRADLGYDPSGVSAWTITLPRGLFSDPAQRSEHFRRAVDQVRLVGGVTSASATATLPLRDAVEQAQVSTTAEEIAYAERRRPSAWSSVLPGYFSTMRTAMLAGRDFASSGPADSAAAREAVVNAAFVRERLGNGDALGRTVAIGGGPNPRQYVIVGVVANARHGLRSAGEPQIYVNANQVTGSTMTIVARTSSNRQLLEEAQARLAGMHALIQPYDETSMNDVVAQAMVRERVTGALLSMLSAVAAVLLAVGVFGVLSAMVSERSKELALRLALGASPRGATHGIVSYLGRVGAGALLVAIPSAWVASHLLKSLLYGVSANTVSAYVWALAAVVGATLIASFGPLRRALSVQPMDVLRE